MRPVLDCLRWRTQCTTPPAAATEIRLHYAHYDMLSTLSLLEPDMNPTAARRQFLNRISHWVALGLASTSGLVKVGLAWAAPWDKATFETKAYADTLKSLQISNLIESRDITITAPDIAENSALVAVAINSKIPNSQTLYLIAEKNPFPLVSRFDFSAGAEAYASVRIKMGQTSTVRAIIKADDKYYTAAREIKITVGGCG